MNRRIHVARLLKAVLSLAGVKLEVWVPTHLPSLVRAPGRWRARHAGAAAAPVRTPSRCQLQAPPPVSFDTMLLRCGQPASTRTYHPNDRRPDKSRGLGVCVWGGGHGHRRCDSEASRAGPAISKPPRGLEHATVTLSTARSSGATRMRPAIEPPHSRRRPAIFHAEHCAQLGSDSDAPCRDRAQPLQPPGFAQARSQSSARPKLKRQRSNRRRTASGSMSGVDQVLVAKDTTTR